MAEMDDEDDEQDYQDDEPETSGFFRWLQVVIVLIALGGFFGLAWYAYRSDEATDEKDVDLVKVEKTPVKEAPPESENPQVPNQDKTVYNLVDSDKPQDSAVAERLMPTAEAPLQPKVEPDSPAAQPQPAPAATPAADTGSSVKTWKRSDTKPLHVTGTAVVAPTPAPSEKSTKATAAPVATVKQTPVAAAVTKTPVVVASAAKAEDQATESSDAIEEVPTGNDAAKPSNAPASTPLPKIRVQLGAFKSEGDAEKEWARIAHKFRDDLSAKQHYVVRVELEKGIFYRLQAAPFSSAQEADALCVTLMASEQPCMLARGK